MNDVFAKESNMEKTHYQQENYPVTNSSKEIKDLLVFLDTLISKEELYRFLQDKVSKNLTKLKKKELIQVLFVAFEKKIVDYDSIVDKVTELQSRGNQVTFYYKLNASKLKKLKNELQTKVDKGLPKKIYMPSEIQFYDISIFQINIDLCIIFPHEYEVLTKIENIGEEKKTIKHFFNARERGCLFLRIDLVTGILRYSFSKIKKINNKVYSDILEDANSLIDIQELSEITVNPAINKLHLDDTFFEKSISKIREDGLCSNYRTKSYSTDVRNLINEDYNLDEKISKVSFRLKKSSTSFNLSENHLKIICRNKKKEDIAHVFRSVEKNIL